MSQLVSIIIPTRNEEKNIGRLLQLIAASVTIPYEAIVVDDSDNNQTAAIATGQGARIIQGQYKGLGQAILDGIMTAQGNIVVVMDADLSHNPHDIPGMLRPILYEGYDMTIGSRYVKGGEIIGWEWNRKVISRVACLLALPITSIKDATSGFFAFRKSIIDGVQLEASSWKIMLEVLLKAKLYKVAELPIQFEVRREGKSKFNSKQMLAYLKHLGKLLLYKRHDLLWLIAFKFVGNPDSPDYDWKGYYRGNFIQKWWKHNNAKIIWEWMPNASKLLDIGCGSSPIITKYPKAIGIDMNKDKIAFIKNKWPHATFRIMSAEGLKFNDNTFDHVICSELIEHLHNPELAIKEIARVLKLYGHAIIATPDYARMLWQLIEKFTPTEKDHVYRFTRKTLEETCKQYGLEPVRHKYTFGCDLTEEFVKVS